METILYWVLFALGVLALVRRQRRRRQAVLLSTLLLGLAVAGNLLWANVRATQEAAAEERKVILPREELRADYVGSAPCKACHPTQFTTWHDSYHRTMTKPATPEYVKADFSGQEVKAVDGRIHIMERRGDHFFDRVPGGPSQRIEMATGSHNMQAFWVRGNGGNALVEFPFTYLLRDRKWVRRGDVFLTPPEFQKNVSTWNQVCVECHATRAEPRLNADTGTPDSRVVELGISCESCHGPGGRHVVANQNPLRRFALRAKSDARDDTIVNPARLPAPRAAEVCGQCHGIACNLNGWQWSGLPYKPGDELEAVKPLIRLGQYDKSPCASQIAADPDFTRSRFWSDGMVRVGGRDYSALVQSPCFKGGKLSCESCHSPHKGTSPEFQVLPEAQGNQGCLQCHPSLAADVPAHTHHAAESVGSSCYGCHMPHTVWGLMKGIRSHQVSSPAVASSLETGRPNACNLCHLDRSLGWTADLLQKWYGQEKPKLSERDETVSRGVVEVLKGDAGVRGLIAWHMGYGPSQKASGVDWIAPYLADLLDDRYTVVRYNAGKSLRTLPGYTGFEYDFIGAPAARDAAKERALDDWRETAVTRSGADSTRLLIVGPGQRDRRALKEILKDRDDRDLVLAE